MINNRHKVVPSFIFWWVGFIDSIYNLCLTLKDDTIDIKQTDQ